MSYFISHVKQLLSNFEIQSGENSLATFGAGADLMLLVYKEVY